MTSKFEYEINKLKKRSHTTYILTFQIIVVYIQYTLGTKSTPQSAGKKAIVMTFMRGRLLVWNVTLPHCLLEACTDSVRHLQQAIKSACLALSVHTAALDYRLCANTIRVSKEDHEYTNFTYKRPDRVSTKSYFFSNRQEMPRF